MHPNKNSIKTISTAYQRYPRVQSKHSGLACSEPNKLSIKLLYFSNITVPVFRFSQREWGEVAVAQPSQSSDHVWYSHLESGLESTGINKVWCPTARLIHSVLRNVPVLSGSTLWSAKENPIFRSIEYLLKPKGDSSTRGFRRGLLPACVHFCFVGLSQLMNC